MCRRFKLLYRIEDATVDEIIHYLSRLRKLFIVFLIIGIIDLVSCILTQGTGPIIWNAVGLYLYAQNLGCLAYLLVNPTVFRAKFPITSATLLCAFNIASIVNEVVSYHSYWGIFSVISVLIQFTTIYILYKLMVKMTSNNNTIQGADIETNFAPF